LRDNPFTEEGAVDRFVAHFRSQITGVLSGFDRLVFRGSLLPLIRDGGMYFFLEAAKVRLLDFKDFVLKTSESVKQAALGDVHRDKRPLRYLESSKTDKEDLAHQLLAKNPVTSGLVCVFTTVEPCMSFEYHRSQDRNERGLKLRPKKCLHVYKYFIHPDFGFMGARLQTWFPFNIQVWLNGREWLAVHLKRKSVDFKRHDNCFTWLGDVEAAQRLMDKQLETDWARALTDIARSLNPLHATVFKPMPMDYYWCAYQSEWATDIMFKDPRSLAAVYPALVKHAMFHFSSADVMRFLGRKAHGNYTGELVTSFKDRPEGVRVKHWVDGNSIKMYDKAGSDLRIETTVAKTSGFKVFRPLQNDPNGKLAWRPLRKGIADLHRRAQVSQRANENYLDALSTVDDTTALSSIFDAVSRPVTNNGRRSRAIRIGDPNDVALLKAVCRGEFATAGFRNRDLQRLLHPVRRDDSPEAKRKLSAKIGRQLRLLRAHGLIRKVQKTHRYMLTAKGHLLAAALFAARHATTKQLLREAA
jgi:hypothetical protein